MAPSTRNSLDELCTTIRRALLIADAHGLHHVAATLAQALVQAECGEEGPPPRP